MDWGVGAVVALLAGLIGDFPAVVAVAAGALVGGGAEVGFAAAVGIGASAEVDFAIGVGAGAAHAPRKIVRHTITIEFFISLHRNQIFDLIE